jgi:hypothetical protein
LRAFIGEALDMAQIQAQLGVTYAEIGDDTGLTYAVRRLQAYVKAAFETVDELSARRKARMP